MTASADELAWQEWLLSDHPNARVERARERAANQDQIIAWHEDCWTRAVHVVTDLTAAPAARWRAWQVLDALPTWVAQAEVDAAEPDDVLVERQRSWHAAARRRAGERTYRYPARYLGRRAIEQPIPSDPNRIQPTQARHQERKVRRAHRPGRSRPRDGERDS